MPVFGQFYTGMNIKQGIKSTQCQNLGVIFFSWSDVVPGNTKEDKKQM